MGTQVVRSSNKCFGNSSLIRNASCSNGWLHLAVQSIFAVIIVTSFILILYMMTASQKTSVPENLRKIHCSSNQCMVTCDQVPYFGMYTDDIIAAVSHLRPSCPGVYLTLNRPMFHNETLPNDWLPEIRPSILELEINAGNLKHFTPSVFLSQYAADIRLLVLNRLAISSWPTDSFVGLNNLKELWIRNCTINNVSANVFRAVQGTLESITITGSKYWNPVNITGTITLSRVTMVDFNRNIFNDILDIKSFTGLENCKMLYLNSCNISSIGEGTFDNLRNIEELYLNDNNLINIPTTLFNNMLALTDPRPRINLYNNNWHCDCFARHIYKLVSSGAMLTDPVCKQPERYVGKTFDQMVSHCNYTNNQIQRILSTQLPPTHSPNSNISSIVYTNNGCYKGDIKLESENYTIISPISDHECPANNIRHEDLHNVIVTKSKNPIPASNNWIKFTFFLKTSNYSIIETSSTETNEHGILWYQSTCPNEAYCINMVPQAFRIFNMDTAADYVFCPIIFDSGVIQYDKCVTYNTKTVVHPPIKNKFQIVFVILIGGTCLIMGALCVYALVRKHPTLLKGSKRIVFVKHKTVDALVLPPKVPIRNDLANEVKQDLKNEQIFILPDNSFGKFNRNISTRSNKSYAPSYISALQPTELQLSDWRNKNDFANEPTSEFSPYSWICNADTHIYTELIDNEKTYESLK